MGPRFFGLLPPAGLVALVFGVYAVFVSFVLPLAFASEIRDAAVFEASPAARAILLSSVLIVSLLLVYVLWCLSHAVFDDPGSLPRGQAGQAEGEGERPQAFAASPSRIVVEAPMARGPPPRYCRICDSPKPPRTHHCSTCRVCVRKMDHHCPWVGQCVGYGNYKSFILLLWGGWVGTALTLATLAPILTGLVVVLQPTRPGASQEDVTAVNAPFVFPRAPAPVAITLGIASSLLLSLTAFLALHAWLISVGSTTLEGPSQGGPFDHGLRRNWQLVFGRDPRRWLWPGVPADVDEGTRGGTHFHRPEEEEGEEEVTVLLEGA
jgi:hypothetical protein